MGKREELIELAQEIDRQLRAIRQVLRQPFESDIARGNLTGPQRSVMQALVHTNGLSLKELSRQIGLAHSTVSGIVDRLEKRGLIERQTDSGDRRFSRIVPSRLVQDYMRKTLPALTINPLVDALRRASRAERVAAVEGLKTLHRIVGGST